MTKEETGSYPENEWTDKDLYDKKDCGMGTLRFLMESVKPAEISKKDVGWVVAKYQLLTAMIMSGNSFSLELFQEQSFLLRRYNIALQRQLEEFGIDYKPFCGITHKGWEDFKNFADKMTRAESKKSGR
jgi:hypothetical protein